MSFSTEVLDVLRRKVENLKNLVGNDTPESITKSCSNPFNDDDAEFMKADFNMRMEYWEELQDAQAKLEKYLNQYV